MTARATSQLLIQALIRTVQAEGGFATVIHKGDIVAGAILILCIDTDHQTRLLERQPDFSTGYTLAPIATQYWGNEKEIAQYIDRRRKSDPDLWVIELDIADGERFAAAILAAG
ncbi:MAG: DUF1491 family protein [Sphingomonadaceae bacterium]|jgi:hypothetical protein